MEAIYRTNEQNAGNLFFIIPFVNEQLIQHEVERLLLSELPSICRTGICFSTTLDEVKDETTVIAGKLEAELLKIKR